MSNDVRQWLAEIKELKQQLANSIRDRDSANESAANWRHLYNTEAQQRRSEARLAQEQLDALKLQIQQLQREKAQVTTPDSANPSAIKQEVAKLQTIEQLQQKLIQVMMERDRLTEALKIEQANHAQTRNSLTAVIGDTIDQLTKQRGTAEK